MLHEKAAAPSECGWQEADFVLERFTAHFHNASFFETFNVQTFSQLRERLEGQTGVGPTSLVWFNHLRDHLHHCLS